MYCKYLRIIISCFLSSIILPVYALNYEVEPNNSLNSAMVISPGRPVKGNVNPSGEFDIFKIIPTITGKMRIIYQRPPHGYQYYIAVIRVLSSTGTELAKKSVYAPDSVTTLDLDVKSGSSYFIEVTGCPSGSCANYGGKTYELTAHNFSNPTFETEPNNSISSANKIGPNSLVYAYHNAKSDEDFFKVVLPGPGNFSMRITRPSDGYQYILGDIAILDSSGTVMNANNIYAPDGTAELVLGTTGPKTIYLRMKSCTSTGRCDIFYDDDYQLFTSFDGTVQLTIANVSITEGNSGTKQATFTLRLSEPSKNAVTYNIATVNGTAISGVDYIAKSLSGQTIPAGSISKTFTVSINGDTTKEPNETFYVKVSNVIGATLIQGQAVGTIVNDD
mgnify:CR=1 FL=1